MLARPRLPTSDLERLLDRVFAADADLEREVTYLCAGFPGDLGERFLRRFAELVASGRHGRPVGAVLPALDDVVSEALRRRERGST
jgi:hypothetical protein